MLVNSSTTYGSCLLARRLQAQALTGADELAELTAGKVSRSISLPTWPVYDLTEDAQMSQHLR